MNSKSFDTEILSVGTELLLGHVTNTDARDISEMLSKIGTFETSILPYEDCCTVFTPRHPRTHPTVREVEEAEAALDVETLVNEAVLGTERIAIGYDEED